MIRKGFLATKSWRSHPPFPKMIIDNGFTNTGTTQLCCNFRCQKLFFYSFLQIRPVRCRPKREKIKGFKVFHTKTRTRILSWLSCLCRIRLIAVWATQGGQNTVQILLKPNPDLSTPKPEKMHMQKPRAKPNWAAGGIYMYIYIYIPI